MSENTFWVVQHEFYGSCAGGDKLDSRNDYVTITTEQPVNNLHNTPIDNGWMGRSYGDSMTAHGAFRGVEQAIDAALAIGYYRLLDEVDYVTGEKPDDEVLRLYHGGRRTARVTIVKTANDILTNR